MKIIKIVSFAGFGLVSFGVILGLVDYYIYSWTSNFRLFGCRYKTVSIEREDHALSEDYDLMRIGDEVRHNSDYLIIPPPNVQEGVLYTKYGLYVVRVFQGINYNMNLYQQPGSEEQFVDIHNLQIFGLPTNVNGLNGELPATPNSQLRENINQMIADMPLSDAQKKEISAKVRIKCAQRTVAFF